MGLMGLVLLAILPHTLGDFGYNGSETGKIIASKSDVTNTAQKFKASDLQTVFTDTSCNNCIKCMERAITAHKINNNDKQIMNVEDSNHLDGELQREKRKVVGEKTEGDAVVTVAKYFAHGKLHALKVKEYLDGTNTKEFQKCDVYKVEHSYPCDSTKAKLILISSKIHLKRKNKEKVNLKNDQVVNKTDENL